MTCKEKNKIYSVSEITWKIKSQIEANFSGIYVQGEISNFKKQASGHIYFSLKDNNSQINCALFRNTALRIKQLPKDGDTIVVFGEISVYPPKGSYQIIVRDIRLVGLGELLLKLYELKKELENQGWFDPARKKKLPFLPKCIGVVTSPTGAVIQDILHVLSRRFTNFHLLLNPVKVQGEGAAEEIAQAIHDFNKYQLVDVMIIGRGGGSLEDLWPFNERIVAEAIFSSKIPIISAVGHETDYSISDFVADVRAPTPSAAAEIVIQEKKSLIQNLTSIILQIKKNTLHSFSVAAHRLSLIKKHPVFSFPYQLTGAKLQQMDEKRTQFILAFDHFFYRKKTSLLSLRKQLEMLNPLLQIFYSREKLKKTTYHFILSWNHFSQAKKEKFDKKNIKKRFFQFIHLFLSTKKRMLQDLSSHIRSIDPKNLLKKGYSILFSEKDSSIILSCQQLNKSQRFTALVSDGKIKAITEEIEKL